MKQSKLGTPENAMIRDSELIWLFTIMIQRERIYSAWKKKFNELLKCEHITKRKMN